MRSFVALDLPDAARDDLSALQSELRVGRKVPWDNLHLTLAFLDDQPETVLGALHDELSTIRLPSFDLRLSGIELLGGKAPKLLYVRADGGSGLQGLRDAVRAAARTADIALPRERFRPHVTLARFRRDMMPDDHARLGAFLAARADASLPVFAAHRFNLYRSTLHPGGADHEILAQYDLLEGNNDGP